MADFEGIITASLTGDINQQVGFTTVVDIYITPVDYTLGVSWDSANVSRTDSINDKLERFVLFTTTVDLSIASPNTNPRDISNDADGNYYSCDFDNDMLYKHVLLTTTISISIAGPGVGGAAQSICWTGTNTITDVSAVDSLTYLLEGFTTTPITSIANPVANTAGQSWDGINLMSACATDSTMKLHVLFTTTISISIAAKESSSLGITWGNATSRLGGNGNGALPPVNWYH